MSNDVPIGLLFTDPTVVETTYRYCLWAAPGEGKSVAAASAPAPILLVNADRPSAYAFARRHHGHTAMSLRETRFDGPETLASVTAYLRGDGQDIATVVLDPWSNIYDVLVEAAPKRADGDIDYQWVNRNLMRFLVELRKLDVHVILVAHEKINDGKKGDGKLYPRLGGGTLISKVMGEMDVVAHLERTVRDGQPVWFAQVQPTPEIVGKDGSDALGEKRVADLSRWVELMRESTSPDTDLPWGSGDDGQTDAAPTVRSQDRRDAHADAASDATPDAAASPASGDQLPPSPGTELRSSAAPGASGPSASADDTEAASHIARSSGASDSPAGRQSSRRNRSDDDYSLLVEAPGKETPRETHS